MSTVATAQTTSHRVYLQLIVYHWEPISLSSSTLVKTHIVTQWLIGWPIATGYKLCIFVGLWPIILSANLGDDSYGLVMDHRLHLLPLTLLCTFVGLIIIFLGTGSSYDPSCNASKSDLEMSLGAQDYEQP